MTAVHLAAAFLLADVPQQPARCHSASPVFGEAGTAAGHELKALACRQPRVSDKFNDHNYELMYGMFLMPLRFVRPAPKVLEIGLGCNMHYGAGASAKVWREALPEAELWFADVDDDCVQKHMA